MKPKSKEVIIVLPNRDEWPAGKTKDEAKLLGLIAAEYELGDDIGLFRLDKHKGRYAVRLAFIPCSVADLRSVNGKKFVAFELIRSEIGSVVRFDDELNRRAAAILDLVHSDDPNARETVRAKLSAILDIGDELDRVVDLLLTDAQFNSFKYTVLNNNKTTCLLCVNTGGIYIRSIEAPFDVQDSALWIDVKDISCKSKKLSIIRNYGHVTEVTFLNKKAASLAHQHLRQYLAFMGTKTVPEPSNWFGRISQRIRKSFGRKSTSRTSGSQINSPSSEKPTSSALVQHKSTAPSTIPDSSFISEDVMDNPISMVEPSLKTNSTYDVSLGSDNSYRPTLTSLSNEELSNADRLYSFQKPLSQYSDDHASMKTTSTYEVSLDSRQLGKPTSNDNDSFNATGQSGQLYSFGTTSSSRASPPLVAPVKKETTVPVMERGEKQRITNRPPIIKPEEPIDVVVKEEEKSVKALEEQPIRSVVVSTSTVTTTRWEPTVEMSKGLSGNAAWSGDDRIPIRETHDVRVAQELPIATSGSITGPIPVVAAAAPINKTPPELPIRTVTEYVSQRIVVPEPPIRTISQQVDHSYQLQLHHPSEEAVEEELEEAISKIGPDPIRKPMGMMHDTNRKLSLTIEPIKEEDVVTQSMYQEESIDDTITDMSCLQRSDSGGEHGVIISDDIMPAVDTVSVTDDDAMPYICNIQSIDVSHSYSQYSQQQDLLPISQPATDIATSTTTITTTTTTTPLGPPDSPLEDDEQRRSIHDTEDNRVCDDASLANDETAATTTMLESAPDLTNARQRPDILDIGEQPITDGSNSSNLMKSDSKLPMSRTRSIPSPKVQRPSRIPAKSISSPKDESASPFVLARAAQSPSDKENYQNDKLVDANEGPRNHHHLLMSSPEKPPSSNFSRFESQEYKVDSKTTFTSVSTVGDNIVKKSTQTEISSIKSTGIPTPKQYKSTTTITSTIKKPADISKSPSNSATKIPTGIPRMSSK